MNQKFERDALVPELPGLIVLSHGPLAMGIVASAEMLYGREFENIAAFCLEPQDDPQAYCAAFTKAYEAMGQNAVFLLDLFGGTPCNLLMRHAHATGTRPAALAGVNLPTLLQAAVLREDLQPQELVCRLMQEAGESMVDVTSRMR